jgi:hypothetical protein
LLSGWSVLAGAGVACGFGFLTCGLGFGVGLGEAAGEPAAFVALAGSLGAVALVEFWVAWFVLAGVVVAGFLAAGFGDGLAVAAAAPALGVADGLPLSGTAVPGVGLAAGFVKDGLPEAVFSEDGFADAGFGEVALVEVDVVEVSVAEPAFACLSLDVASGLVTLGRRWARRSAARTWFVDAARLLGRSSALLVTISTSSSRARSAAGLILMARKGSLSWSGATLVTVPTGTPLG